MTRQQFAADARREFAAVRTMRRNLRLGRYQGRNSGGDSSYKMERAAQAARECGRDLEAMLWNEHRLAERLSENRDAGNPRPELVARLASVRRELRKEMTA